MWDPTTGAVDKGIVSVGDISKPVVDERLQGYVDGALVFHVDAVVNIFAGVDYYGRGDFLYPNGRDVGIRG